MLFRQSETGYDVRDASDLQIQTHAEFFDLPIAFSNTYTGATTGTVILTHNLGYPPVYYCSGLFSSRNIPLPGLDTTGTIISIPPLVYTPGVSSTVLQQDPFAPTNIATNGSYILFARDLREAINPQDYELTPAAFNSGGGIAQNASSQLGIDVRSANITEQAMIASDNSAPQNPRNILIHSQTVGTFSTTGFNTITVTHNLGYVPTVWWFMERGLGGNWERCATGFGNLSTSTNTVNSVLVTPNTAGASWSCIILKNVGVL